MAFETTQQHIPGAVAGADMTAEQFHVVGPDGVANNSWDAGPGIAVVQNAPNVGEAATVAFAGVTKVKVGTGGVTGPDFVKGDTDGRAIALAGGGGEQIVGLVFEKGTFAENTLVSMMIMQMVSHS